MDRDSTGQAPGSLADTPEFQALNPKQRAFVYDYLMHGNATLAYTNAGYKAKGNSAESYASQLLRNIKIQAAVRLAQKKVDKIAEDRFEVTTERITRELAKIAFSNMKRVARWSGRDVSLLDSDDIEDDDAASIKSISVSESSSSQGDSQSVSFSLYDKTKALDILSKIKGMQNGEPDAGKPRDKDLVRKRANELARKYAGGSK